MFAWVKIFTTGEREIGTDRGIENKEASWSRGKLQDISEVYLCSITDIVSLKVPSTEWHQYDRFIFDPSNGKTKRLYRVIQAKIKKEHLGLFIEQEKRPGYLRSFSICMSSNSDIEIKEEMIDKWLSIAVYDRGNSIQFKISDKGKF